MAHEHSTYRQERRVGRHLCDAIQGRQDPTYDQDLEHLQALQQLGWGSGDLDIAGRRPRSGTKAIGETQRFPLASVEEVKDSSALDALLLEYSGVIVGKLAVAGVKPLTRLPNSKLHSGPTCTNSCRAVVV